MSEMDVATNPKFLMDFGPYSGISNVVAGFSPRSAPACDPVFEKRMLAEAYDDIVSCSGYRIGRHP